PAPRHDPADRRPGHRRGPRQAARPDERLVRRGRALPHADPRAPRNARRRLMATRKSAPHTDRDMRSIALALALVACSHAEPSRSSSEPRPLPAPSPAPSEPVLQAGNEEEEPPPDPAALANGRALALPGPNAFLSTWRLLHEGPLANEAS